MIDQVLGFAIAEGGFELGKAAGNVLQMSRLAWAGGDLGGEEIGYEKPLLVDILEEGRVDVVARELYLSFEFFEFLP